MIDQSFDCWFSNYPITHKWSGQTVQVVTRARYDEVVGHLERQRIEALDVLSRQGASNYEKVQAVGLILSRKAD